LSENISQQTAREENVIGRLDSQNRCFVSKLTNPFLRIPSKSGSSVICRSLEICFSRINGSRL
jgi:hypothetical protein